MKLYLSQGFSYKSLYYESDDTTTTTSYYNLEHNTRSHDFLQSNKTLIGEIFPTDIPTRTSSHQFIVLPGFSDIFLEKFPDGWYYYTTTDEDENLVSFKLKIDDKYIHEYFKPSHPITDDEIANLQYGDVLSVETGIFKNPSSYSLILVTSLTFGHLPKKYVKIPTSKRVTNLRSMFNDDEYIYDVRRMRFTTAKQYFKNDSNRATDLLKISQSLVKPMTVVVDGFKSNINISVRSDDPVFTDIVAGLPDDTCNVYISNNSAYCDDGHFCAIKKIIIFGGTMYELG